jgi:hypothetical protein
MTKQLIDQVVRTLDIPQFVAGMSAWDSVTRRQCLYRALQELAAPASILLHGRSTVKQALDALADEIQKLPTINSYES